MVRNCTIAVVLWVALVAAYVIYVWNEVPWVGSLVAATAVWIGLVMINGARYALRDWNARNRMARSERPRDGELVSAVGELRGVMDTLRAPFSGRECVYYSYELGAQRTEKNYAARDYSGFGMARSAVHTPYGSFTIGSLPVVEGLGTTPVDRDLVKQYIGSTEFTPLDGLREMVRTVAGLHTQPPPVKVDWRIGEPRADIDAAEIKETIIEPGTTVTAIGRYVAASNAIVSDTNDQGYLRIRRGGDARKVSVFPFEAAWKLLGGLAFIVGANAVLYLARG